MTAFTKARPKNSVEGIHFREDFFASDLVGDNTLGLYRWELQTIGNASTIAHLADAATSRPGGIRITTAGTADGDGEALQMADDTATFPASGGGGGFAFLFRYPSVAGNALAGNNFRIGVHSALDATEPTDGIWLDSDAGVLSLDCASADHGDTTIALSQPTVGATLTSGTTAVLGTWHLAEVWWEGENGQGGPRIAYAAIDGILAGSVLCNIDDDETAEIKILHWQDSGGADTLELDIKFIEYWQHYDLPTAGAV